MTAPLNGTTPFSKADRITFMIVGGMIGLGILAAVFLQ
jgi:hypothetical protein